MTGFKVGDKVLFGRDNGEKTLGEIVRVNRVKLKVKQLESRGTMRSYPVGTIWTVPPALCTLVGNDTAASAPAKAKRSDDEILRDIRSVHAALSPENLHCDGEISRSAAARKATHLRAKLRALETELGRKPSDAEVWGDLTSGFTPPLESAPLRRPTPKGSGFIKGERVAFDHPTHGTIKGTVERINRKTITLTDTDDGRRGWRVPPSMLRKA